MIRVAAWTILVSILFAFAVPFVDVKGRVLAQTTAVSTPSVQQITNEIKNKIQSKTDEISRLEKEIEIYQKELRTVSSEANSLSQAISELDITRKKLQAELRVTQAKIDRVNLDIESLSGRINSAAQNIDESRDSLGALMRRVHQADDSSLVEILLESPSVSVQINALENYSRLTGGVTEAIDSLTASKANLETTRSAVQQKRKELTTLKSSLVDQEKLISDTAKEKQSILAITKNRESNYIVLLTDKARQKEEFEREINAYEAALKLVVDPSKLPKAGAGVLQWPLDSVYVTQYFGNTDFAVRNPQGYSGKGHNGIDLRAPIGTPIKSSASGRVIGVGNTGLVKGCYSYGKWVMVEHPNGLSTLYAHLSLPKVVTGQTVYAGEILGYSGNTGYTTGPHLHFGVYASEGVRITAITNSLHCKGAVIPVADYKAYLNPMSYLPNQ